MISMLLFFFFLSYRCVSWKLECWIAGFSTCWPCKTTQKSTFFFLAEKLYGHV